MGLLVSGVIFGGFPAQTAIRTGDHYASIEHVQVGDVVECYDTHSSSYVKKEIIHKKVYKESSCVCIALDGASCITSPDQKFYMADQNVWKMAKDLVPGDLLLGEGHLPIPVEEVIALDQEVELYDIAVKDCHNFLVLKNGILVHNFVPAIAVGASWAFGSGGVQL